MGIFTKYLPQRSATVLTDRAGRPGTWPGRGRAGKRGILASLDPVAIDQACIDLVMQSDDPGKEHFMERVNSRNGIHTIEAAADLGYGTREYELIEF